MLIEEVIDRADELCLNNEYTREMKYHWCDVVGAEITQRYKREFKKVRLERWSDGLFLLPEDCRYENIARVVADGREIPKKDMRTQGYWVVYGVRDRFFLEDRSRSANAVDVIYLKDYEKIRRYSVSDVSVEIALNDDGNTVTGIIADYDCPIIAGDSVIARINSDEYMVNVMSRDMDMDNEDNPRIKLEVVTDIPVELAGTKTARLSRVVTDETECEAPWDEMYIDYICGQICFYQRDMAEYQQFMARYNSRMEEYARHIKAYEPSDESKFHNWWEL